MFSHSPLGGTVSPKTHESHHNVNLGSPETGSGPKIILHVDNTLLLSPFLLLFFFHLRSRRMCVLSFPVLRQSPINLILGESATSPVCFLKNLTNKRNKDSVKLVIYCRGYGVIGLNISEKAGD